MLQTPVLLIVFNRPHTTKRVFEAVRNAQPSKLFIAADAPRPEKVGEKEKCEEVRSIVSDIDWDCEVKTLFRIENKGCGLGPAEAITWFFEHVDQGIILEDDCLPSKDFFRFCSELLSQYANDSRVMMISGTNALGSWKDDIQSYHFSILGGIWGWATWKRAWKFFDYRIENWANEEVKNRVKDILIDENLYLHRSKVYDHTLAGQNVDWWDYQWGFARVTQSGLSIVPSRNLITNIGFGEDATHTKDRFSDLANFKTYPLDFPLKTPNYLMVDRDFDKAFMQQLGIVRNKKTLRQKVKNLLK